MSKNNKKQELKARPLAEITQQYTALCAELGNALLQFEMQKSKAFAQFTALNNEMIVAQQLEAEAQKAKEAKAEQLVQALAERAAQ